MHTNQRLTGVIILWAYLPNTVQTSGSCVTEAVQVSLVSEICPNDKLVPKTLTVHVLSSGPVCCVLPLASCVMIVPNDLYQ